MKSKIPASSPVADTETQTIHVIEQLHLEKQADDEASRVLALQQEIEQHKLQKK